MVLNCVATCLIGMESMVKNELKKIGAINTKAENARVFFSADEQIFVRALINSRYAERILIHLGTFSATSFEELFTGVKNISWENYINEFDSFPIKGNCVNSKLSSLVSCRSIIKKAVCERLKLKYKISWFKQTGPMKLIRFILLKDKITLMLDACGEGLHKRNYKRNFTKAPIKETLAAGLNDFIRIYDDNTLVDPFCGSGTILIEGAMKALNIAPGVNRNFSCEKWNMFEEKLWEDEKQLAKSKVKTNVNFKAYGYDIDEASLDLAKQNAKRAGVSEYIKFKKQDIKDFNISEENAVVVTNPPYGIRLSDKTYANKIYKTMGKVLYKNNLKKVCVISPEENFEKIYGKAATKRRKLYNGTIKCNAYAFY